MTTRRWIAAGLALIALVVAGVRLHENRTSQRTDSSEQADSECTPSTIPERLIVVFDPSTAADQLPAILAPVRGTVEKTIGQYTYVIRVPAGAESAAMTYLRSDPDVRSVGPDDINCAAG